MENVIYMLTNGPTICEFNPICQWATNAFNLPRYMYLRFSRWEITDINTVSYSKIPSFSIPVGGQFLLFLVDSNPSRHTGKSQIKDRAGTAS